MATPYSSNQDRREVPLGADGSPTLTSADANRTAAHAPSPNIADPPSAAAPAGFVIGNRYEVGAVIARGGMGAVYSAVDRMFDREVAVKLVREEFVGTVVADRFYVEARITSQLQHPGVPPVHEVGALPDGRPYLVMKLIKGRTLADLLKERETPGADLNKFLPIFEQVCLAVAFAHARGIIHRDLKPDNVMVGAFGEVQVMDWGLAKGPNDPAPSAETPPDDFGQDIAGHTRHGTVLGTLAYMAPEQARGETDRIDMRSDVFGLGAILCVILTGKPPHTAHGAEALRRKAATADLDETLKNIRRSPGSRLVTRLAERCLAALPEARPAHAGEVAATLHSVMNYMEKSVRQNEVHDATAEADEGRRAAGRWARTALQFGLAGVLLGGAAAAISQWNAGNREAAARETVVRSKDLYRELFPLELSALATDVDAGVSKESRVSRSVNRVSLLLGGLEPQERTRGYLALAAAADAIKGDADARPDEYWQRAARQYRAVAPEATEVELACEAVKWDFPDPLRRTVLRQARDRLQKAMREGKIAESARQQAADALEVADAALATP